MPKKTDTSPPLQGHFDVDRWSDERAKRVENHTNRVQAKLERLKKNERKD